MSKLRVVECDGVYRLADVVYDDAGDIITLGETAPTIMEQESYEDLRREFDLVGRAFLYPVIHTEDEDLA